MTDPTRWSNNDMTEIERQLLDAARGDHVPDVLSARMADALRVGDAALSSAPTIAKVPASMFVNTTLWGVLSIGLVTAGAGWYALRPGPAAKPAATFFQQVVEPSLPAQIESTSNSGPRASGDSTVRDLAPSRGVLVPPRHAKAIQNGDSLRAEVELLARARQALQQQATGRALRLLDRHRGQFVEGILAPEADALRIEALIQEESYSLAQAKMEHFLKTYPVHPLRAHVVGLMKVHGEPVRPR